MNCECIVREAHQSQKDKHHKSIYVSGPQCSGSQTQEGERWLLGLDRVGKEFQTEKMRAVLVTDGGKNGTNCKCAQLHITSHLKW
jgi:hypothetical protein